MQDSVEDMLESAAAGHSPHPRAGSMAGARSAAVADITAAEDIMAAEDITAPVLDSVSAFTRLTDMPLRPAIPPDSMMQTACGSIIRVALCRTDIKLDGRAALRCVVRLQMRNYHLVSGFARKGEVIFDAKEAIDRSCFRKLLDLRRVRRGGCGSSGAAASRG
jgi:hypothetical protein